MYTVVIVDSYKLCQNLFNTVHFSVMAAVSPREGEVQSTGMFHN